MTDIQVLPLGVGNAFTLDHYKTSLLIRDPDTDYVLAVDCPDLYRQRIHELSDEIDWLNGLNSIDSFLITHLHGDHVNGLEEVLFYNTFKLNDFENGDIDKTDIWLHKKDNIVLWDKLDISMGRFLYRGNVVEVTDKFYYDKHVFYCEGGFHIGPFTLRAELTEHHVPSVAIKVFKGNSTFGFSSDTNFQEDVLSFIENSDLIFHEAGFGEGHTSIDKLEKWVQDKGIEEKFRLIHCPDSFFNKDMELDMAKEGDIYKIG